MRLQSAARVLVATDFDGTLAPIVARPEDAVPLPLAVAALTRLACMPAVRVAVVSGRSLNDVRARCPIPGGAYVGGHGLETSDGPGLAAPQLVRRQMQAVAERLRPLLAGWPGARVEAKAYSLAVHFRQAPQFGEAIQDTFSRWADAENFRVLLGRKMVELLPRDGQNKGQAVHRLRARLGCDLALYFGDDVTDEDVFAFPDPQIIGIKVEHAESAPASAAQFCLPGPEAMPEALLAIVEAAHRPPKKKLGFYAVQP